MEVNYRYHCADIPALKCLSQRPQEVLYKTIRESSWGGCAFCRLIAWLFRQFENYDSQQKDARQAMRISIVQRTHRLQMNLFNFEQSGRRKFFKSYALFSAGGEWF
ncbi:hypothetical protein CC78DRAFT_295767 [Lojkania enalia]|uniref:Uncharacterized protein n=1 Tax=Lojkania enalia TaxID=147567 RepID=A0A9P4MYU2_9PLEO|nr:hypothetical protein CC78DRAFT_295767 [Didymosphaeria enalia]